MTKPGECRERFKDVQHHQRGNPGAVRRQFVDLPATVGRRHRIGPLRAELRQVGCVHRRAAPLEAVDEPARNIAAIERLAAASRNLAIRPRKIDVPENSTHGRRPPVGQERLRRLRIASQERLLDVPFLARNLGHWKPVLRERDGWLEQTRERQPAKPIEKKRPSRDRTRDSHRVNAALRHAALATALEKIGRQPRRRPPAGVHAVQRSVALADDREQIAADAAHHGTDDAHHCIGGNGRVDRVPSLRQRHRAGL